ncbi:hypothetical protein CP960_08975 [Malaciobacter halophilus]|uniref:histidine kinase n=1 Tax=Malaciobacter halophilus TaxID=197482 RepID=A0A2N1J202_9BACT|nr:transporter substrate-binding domain-containing protein [Malaciobacter halophilus]AXH10851.1 BvgS-like domain-containing signal transduction sensor histidine kinase (PAS domain) [Malaciobacter halophilus]PKI80534.1 hypothetical protein CP960_08975 [Malaciobacter halophilus]
MRRFLIFLIFLNISLFSDEIFTKEEKEFIKNSNIKIVSATPWEPFHVIDNGVQTGISYDIWSLIKQKTGLKSESIQLESFTKVLNSIKQKRYDMALSVGKTKDRQKYAKFTKSYATFPISIATTKDVRKNLTINDLKSRVIAVGKNYTAHKKLQEQYPFLKFVLVKDIREGLKLLSDNKVFAYIDIMPVLSYNINKLGYTNLRISGNTGIDFDVTFMIRDDYKELISIVNKVIATISSSEKQAILNKWIAVIYHDEPNYEIILYILSIVVIIVSIVMYKNRQLLKYQEVIKQKNSVLEKQKEKLLETNYLLEDTQKSLENSLNSFKVLLNSTIEAIIIVRDNKIKYANESFLKVFEYKNNDDVFNTYVDNHFARSILNKELNNKAFEFQGIDKSGNEFPILVKKESIFFENKKSLIISIFDLTELKQKEKLILEQSKLVSMGEMIGNIAHQWRQPLTAITTAASSLKLRKELGDFTDEVLNESVEAIMRNSKFLSQTIDDFKNYLKDTKQKEQFNIKDLFEQSLSLIRPALENSFIENRVNIEHDIFIKSYFNELNQAMLNILNNAKDALIDSQIEQKIVFLKAYMQEDEVVIEIKDTAGGIKEEILNSIFEPYFTTKHQSQGTGLGLYMTYKIITESLNGSIEAQNVSFTYNNSMHKGAKFIIRLPYN